MGYRGDQSKGQGVWRIAAAQHDVIARGQLVELGYAPQSIKHRVAKGRLHPLWPGVYAVGTPNVTRKGRWMAAVLTCGPNALLSHQSAGELCDIRRARAAGGIIDVSVPAGQLRRRRGIRVHRRGGLRPEEITEHHGIPLTAPATTLIDLAATLPRGEVEAAVNAADKLDLITPDELRRALDAAPRRRGVGVLRALLDRATFALTDSELERLFLPLVRSAGLPQPETQQWVNGVRVDFFWPELGLVVETDGLRYHRTATQQLRDRRRDQIHTATGLTYLRFSHGQVRFEAGHVRAILAATGKRLSRGRVE